MVAVVQAITTIPSRQSWPMFIITERKPKLPQSTYDLKLCEHGHGDSAGSLLKKSLPVDNLRSEVNSEPEVPQGSPVTPHVDNVRLEPKFQTEVPPGYHKHPTLTSSATSI